MDDAWKRMRTQYEEAYRAMLRGDPGPFKALWSHREDICLFGALGDMEQGWAEVRPRYDCYRREDGEWRIFHRHGDELRPASPKI